ncbi:MAG: hypothetical protein CSA18_03640 [Deltaproteobacteria bacterium]|nr:MAG: hypothetical protein CSA18_03640 [Deltaproteobacteria bacterium]
MESYQTLAEGVLSKKHQSRKHGIKKDQYFKIRFQYNHKRIDSGIGWASEVLNLRWKNIDLEHSIINLTKTKGDKSRTTYMTQNIKKFLAEKKGSGEDLVFPSRDGKVSPQTSKFFAIIANELFNKNVVDPRQKVVFHTLRHTYASWLVMSGVSLYTVQKLLGHSDIKTTMRYAHLSPDYLAQSAKILETFSFEM